MTTTLPPIEIPKVQTCIPPSLDATRWLVPVVSLVNGRTYVMRLVHAVTQQFKGKVRIVSWAKP